MNRSFRSDGDRGEAFRLKGSANSNFAEIEIWSLICRRNPTLRRSEPRLSLRRNLARHQIAAQKLACRSCQ